jgi:hypothetical protein
VDKPDFFHKLKGLRAPQALGQSLCRARIETGQKNGGAQVGQFHTFVPVDMHAFIHSAASFLLGRPGFQFSVCLQGSVGALLVDLRPLLGPGLCSVGQIEVAALTQR